MDDYKLDFGKLAYTKTEDLSVRLAALENKKYDVYNNVSFSEKNAVFIAFYTKNDYFSVEKLTDLSFIYKLTGTGKFDFSVYIDGVFVYFESVQLNGEGSFTFEARGIETGKKTLTVNFTGNGQLSYSVTVTGNNIAYCETDGNISVAAVSNKDYIFRISDGKMILYRYDDVSLTEIKKDFEKGRKCGILKYFDNADYLLLFYTAWDNSVFYELFSISQNKSVKQRAVLQDVTDFTVCRQGDEIYLFYTAQGKCLLSVASLIDGNLVFSQPVKLRVYNADELECAEDGGKIYLVYADAKQNAKLVYSPLNKNAQKETLKFSVSATMEET